MKKRILSILLVCCMVLTLLPATAFAAEVETGARASNPGGLCEHHPEHDEACGYTEGTAEIPCSHEHTEECHSLITRCVHAHTAECYTAESVSENADGLSEAENAAPTECVHACTEESGCILQTSDCKHAHDKDCGYAPASMGKPCTYLCEICDSKDGKTPMPLLGAARPAATQYTYTLHYDANGGSGAPPSQSVDSSEFHVWVPISEIIPTRDGYTFMGWANSRTGKPIYGGNGGYTSCLVVHGYDMSTTIYAIWEVHNHSWGEWTSNGNGTHTRTCITDSSHTETGNCSGGKATSTEKAICETCHTAYGELLQLTKTVITTPPTLPSEGYVGDQYLDGDLKGGEAKVEGTDIVVPGSFRFKHNWGGVVDPGENRMEILFTPDDTETYATAECIVTVTGLKYTITSVIEKVINNMPLGTTFEDLWLPFYVDVKTNTGDIFYSIPVTWDGSSYDPNKYGEQIITGQLDVEGSFYEDELEPTSTVKAIARITLIGDEPIVPTLDPPTYSRQIYSGDFCQLAFSDEYLSGGKATADGETVPGVFTLNEEQELYGYWRRDGGLVQVGPLALKVTFTPDDLQKYTTAECTVNVDVIPRKFRQANTSYIDNKKIGTAFEDLGLPNAFYFFAEADEPNHEGSGLNGNVPGIIKWDDSNYDPNSYEEQTIYGEVNRAEFEKYYIVPEGADLRGVIKVTLQADPAETEITQPPVFRWRNGDFAQPDNTMFVDRSFQMGATGGETADLVDGMAKVKGTDTVVPGTFSFKEGTPRWFDELGENVVTVVFTPTDQHGYRTAETTIKVNVIKNTFKRCEEPDPITEKKLGTTFAGLNLPEIVVVEAIDGLRVGMEVSWEESSYDAQSTAWQTIPGTLVFDANDEHKYQQPEPAVTAAIRVKLLGPEDAPAITTTTLPGGTVGSPYHHQLQATGGGFILWELFSGELPDGLTLKQTTGEINGTPTAEQTAQFTVRALNSVGNDKKELSITITNAPAAEHTITVTTAGGGTASASSTSATAGTEITLTATPNTGYHFKEWQVESLAGLVITNNKFTMPDSNVAIKAIFEEDSPFAPTKHTVTVKTDGNGIAFASPLLAVAGTEITLTAMPKEGYHFKEWQVISGGVAIENNKFLMPDTNVEVKAFFEEGAPPAPTKYTVTVTTEGGGTASASPAKTAAGTEITLTATPNTGYHFKEWQVESPAGLVITNNKFTMPDSNVAIKAIFEEDSPFAPTKHTVTVKTDGNGIAFASPLLAVAGTEITLTAMPKKGYHFKEWQVISGGVAIENNKFLMPDSNVEVNAVFEKDAPPAPTDPGKPSISVTGAYTYNGSEHTATVSGYNPATMDIAGNTATDAGDYTVRVTSKTGRWADGSTGAVTAAWSIGKATQEAPNGLIGVAPTTEGGSDVKITGVDATMEYRAESETIYTTCTGIEIENLPAGNYFVRYAEDHNHFASPDAEVTVGEGTPLADCTITFNASGGSGSMDSVTVNAGTIYILPACGFTAPADQEFKAWEIGGTEYKVGDSYTVLVDTEIKALWENSVITPTTYTVTVSNDGNGTASASHAKAAAGTEITLTATPQIGYHFKGWQVESPAGLVITNNKFTMPDGNVDVKAIFEKDAPPAPTEFIVTFDGNGGTPSVGSMTTTDRKLTALPSASRSGSYSFYGWYTEKSGGTKITTDTVFHANATVYAHWTYTGGGGGDYNPPVTYYTLRFETGGGSDIPSVQGTYNTYIDLTKYVPTWRGHAFIGWYSERSLTNKVSGVCLTKDMTVYAGWRVDENPGTGVNPFTDISEKDWFYGDVMFVYENGLMLGTSKTLFSPHGTAMRGMMATILWRMEGSPVPKGKNSFTDVEAGKWYADAITWTAENGIFAGYSKDKFGPDDPITREQLAAIFYRYADYKGYDLTVKGDLDKFKDADKITDYAKTAMQWAVGSGLVKGKSGNLLDPQGTATRAEIAAMLHRFIEKYELVQGKAPGGLMGWIDPKRLQIPKTGDSSV
ncbi:InlB B-repeat-containing protein [Blautia wexlerae]|uniref:InlB B-repeat-containing protein n=1 Tax=Blautia wexlerae TaxID=418240 RepID=UPI00189C58A3|nr:InlB B-repeat-containing protein [Blautia wexlerae]MDC0699764.1 InlB B-repeat-containing protein [Blautia wexlerae]